MLKPATVFAIVMLASLSACGKAPDATNVADQSNSAGAALENSAAELEATTDNLVEGEVANINAESNAAAVDANTESTATAK